MLAQTRMKVPSRLESLSWGQRANQSALCLVTPTASPPPRKYALINSSGFSRRPFPGVGALIPLVSALNVIVTIVNTGSLVLGFMF